MFEIEPSQKNGLPALDSSGHDKDHKWREWVAREMCRRALLSLYIVDGLLVSASAEASSLRHVANQLTFPCSDTAFTAATADDWLRSMHSQKQDSTTFRSLYRSLFSPSNDSLLSHTFSMFSLQVLLEGIQSLVSDCDEDGSAIGIPSRSEIREALFRLHQCIAAAPLTISEQTETFFRWHEVCLAATVDTTMLRKHVCNRYNLSQHVWGDSKTLNSRSHAPNFDMITWAYSLDARRAFSLAVAIQEIVDPLPRGRAHVMHMPSDLFSAATIYTVFSLAGLTSASLPSIVRWRDALSVDHGLPTDTSLSSSTLSETIRWLIGQQPSSAAPYGGSSRSRRNLFYEMNSMQKLFRCLCSQWGVAYDMEHVID